MTPKLHAGRLLPPGLVEVGDYVITKEFPTSIRCKAYTKPPTQGGGEYIMTFPPGTRLGPVEQVEKTADEIAIRVGTFWITRRGGGYGHKGLFTKYAFVDRWPVVASRGPEP